MFFFFFFVIIIWRQIYFYLIQCLFQYTKMAASHKELKKFLHNKKELTTNKGYRIYCLFEAVFIPENSELYTKKLQSLEEKIDDIQCPAPKMGTFLMSGYTKKKFDDPTIKGVRMIHAGSKAGFLSGDIIYLEYESAKISKKQKSEVFVNSLRKIVSDKGLIPDKSIILVTKEDHHMKTDRLRYKGQTPSKAKRLKVAQVM